MVSSLTAASRRRASRKGASFIIEKVYLAADSRKLYMRFDREYQKPASLLHSHNFDTNNNSNYGLRIWPTVVGADRVQVLPMLYCWPPDSRRKAVVAAVAQGRWGEVGQGDYRMK
jgi:hypothetical protein